MNQIFIFLYQIHPWFPAIYLIKFSTGLIAPAIYCATKKLPFSIVLIWRNSKGHDIFAKVAVTAYILLTGVTLICLLSYLERNRT